MNCFERAKIEFTDPRLNFKDAWCHFCSICYWTNQVTTRLTQAKGTRNRFQLLVEEMTKNVHPLLTHHRYIVVNSLLSIGIFDKYKWKKKDLRLHLNTAYPCQQTCLILFNTYIMYSIIYIILHIVMYIIHIVCCCHKHTILIFIFESMLNQ